MKTLIEEIGTPLISVVLTQVKDGIFYSELNFAGEKKISARPSDAIALALRLETSIFATADLFAAVGIEIPDAAEDEVEKFREFLDQINPDDFLG